jgi:hypothetical protein
MDKAIECRFETPMCDVTPPFHTAIVNHSFAFVRVSRSVRDHFAQGCNFNMSAEPVSKPKLSMAAKPFTPGVNWLSGQVKQEASVTVAAAAVRSKRSSRTSSAKFREHLIKSNLGRLPDFKLTAYPGDNPPPMLWSWGWVWVHTTWAALPVRIRSNRFGSNP